MQHDFDPTFMIPDDETIDDYLGTYKNSQQKFKLMGGQTRIIKSLVEYCRGISTDVNCLPSAGSAADSDTTTSEFALVERIGSLMITVYNDAKRTTLSAWSWPSRMIADVMARNYRVNECIPHRFNFQYLTPANHKEFLHCIVASNLKNVKPRILDALAVSARFDGSTDRTQEHNVFLMAHIVHKDATLSTYFIGFGEPQTGSAVDYLTCLKSITTNIMTWEQFFALVTSAVTDGEYLNTGRLNGICTKLKQERLNSNSTLPFFTIWCIAHRINLAWKSLCKYNIIASLIKFCRNLATYFHRSGVRTTKLNQAAATNNLKKPLHYPSLCAIRWTEFSHNLFTVVLRNWRALIAYFSSQNLEARKNKWLSYDRLHLLAFMTDILSILKRYQKYSQSDSLSIIDLLQVKQKMFAKLEICKNGPKPRGWEEKFLQEVTDGDDEIFFYGYELSKTSYRRSRYQVLFTSNNRTYIITKLLQHLKMRFDEDADVLQKLMPLADIRLQTSEAQLAMCHQFIVPDLHQEEFISDYYEAALSLDDNESKPPLHYLKVLVSSFPERFSTLKIAFARVCAAKPHSADVERIINVYNKFKAVDRSGIVASTLFDYLHIRTNMGALEDFDPTSAVQLWMSQKTDDQNHHQMLGIKNGFTESSKMQLTKKLYNMMKS